MKNKKIKKEVLKSSSQSIPKRYLQMIISLFFSAIIYNFLIEPSRITTGGVNGIALILKYISHITPAVTIFIVSAILLVFSYIFLGKERTKGTLVATIVYPLFVYLTNFLSPLMQIDMNDLLVISIFIGFAGGVCNGLLYKTGFSNGGLPIISQIIYDKFKIPIGKTNFVINTIIVLIGGYYFGITMIMYAVIINYINILVVDKILLGVSKNKSIYIVTDKAEKIKQFIMEEMNHTVTVFDVEGAYTNTKREILLTVIPSKEYFEITESIKLLDPNIFYVVSDAYEVKGAK